MNLGLEHLYDRLREARIAKQLSQRQLSKLAGVPQAHISKIENNQVDLRFSSLIALANALDLEVALVPRQAMPVVMSISRQAANNTQKLRNQPAHIASAHTPPGEAKPAYSLDEDDA